MPFGLSWSRYLLTCCAGLTSMFAGATTVHWILKPDLVNQHSC